MVYVVLRYAADGWQPSGRSSVRLAQVLSDRPITTEGFPGEPPRVVRRYDPFLHRLVSQSECLNGHEDDLDFDANNLVRQWLSWDQEPPAASAAPAVGPEESPPEETVVEEEDEVWDAAEGYWEGSWDEEGNWVAAEEAPSGTTSVSASSDHASILF